MHHDGAADRVERPHRARPRSVDHARAAQPGCRNGFAPEMAALDKGYDVVPRCDACTQHGIRPVIPLRQTPAVKAGKPAPPTCEHGTWTFAGSDAKRGASKWRCPTAECTPVSAWVKADRLHPLIPHTTARFKALYRCRRARVRSLKHEWAMLPLRVRRIERVRLQVASTGLVYGAWA
jgi:hypothetical protein